MKKFGYKSTSLQQCIDGLCTTRNIYRFMFRHSASYNKFVSNIVGLSSKVAFTCMQHAQRDTLFIVKLDLNERKNCQGTLNIKLF